MPEYLTYTASAIAGNTASGSTFQDPGGYRRGKSTSNEGAGDRIFSQIVRYDLLGSGF